MGKQSEHVDPPLTGPQQAAIQAAVAPQPETPQGFGAPSFSWPEKVYGTKDGKTTTHARYTVSILGTPFVLDAVIWRTVDEKAQEVEYSVGLPRGVVLSDAKDEALRDQGDTWRIGILEAFDKWAEGQSGSGAVAKRRMAPRLRKKLATTATASSK